MQSSPRVVSLIASATEIVQALGCEDWLVGRSHECDYPPSVLSLPACSSTNFNVHGDSRQIDERVKATLLAATSIYQVDTDLLNELAPNVILTQSQCEVCAVSLRDVQKAVCRVVTSQPQILSLQPNSLAEIWIDIQNVGQVLEEARRSLQRHSPAVEQGLTQPRTLTDVAAQRVNQLQQRLDILSKKCAEQTGPRPSVACIEWIEPLMAAGNWVPELVALARGGNLFGEPGKHSPWMSWPELVSADPDVIVIMPCGFGISKTQSEMHWLTAQPEWNSLSAVRHHQVFITDGNQYFNRPGPRVVESAEILAEILYPGVFNFGHQGQGWVPWKQP